MRKRKHIIHSYQSLHQQAISRAQPNIDIQLLSECAYYPRLPAFGRTPKCTYCSFDKPNLRCKWAHILIDSRIGACELCQTYHRHTHEVGGRQLCLQCLSQMAEKIKEMREEVIRNDNL